MSDKVCPVCKTPIQVFKVYSHSKKKFIQMEGACVPCKEKTDKELRKKLSPKSH